jgi:triosephosphate isomerase
MLEINKFDRIIVANWKLNGSIDFIEQYLQELNCSKLENSNNCGIICTPSVYFHKLVGRLNSLFLGGQDCSNYSEGAYTGEVSATMLKDASCQFCIIGHSERRQIFGQTNEDVCIKAMNLIANNINPIICIGETFEEKNQNLTKDIIYTQISKSVPKNATKDFVIIAYEPIWAIGTGKIPSLEEIDNIHSFIKNEIQNIENYKILYGGSVNSNNASEIMDLKNVDGVLVGGASLDALEYKKIMNS